MTEDYDSNSISQSTITSYATLQKSVSSEERQDASHNVEYDSSIKTDKLRNENGPDVQESAKGEFTPGSGSGNGDANDNTSNENCNDNSNNDNTFDPLGVKELALNFDYLMYKINDRIKTLSERAQASTARLKENTETTIMEIDKVIQFYHEVARKLDEINNDFGKAEQISMIIEEFVPRVAALERYFNV